ncbi:TetR/AcrR family transcriptional regulator [Streptomyces graminilatus]|uniref:TetR/AcrR family transcriptional regulator n=1 Tax=Streptomyces graminilatus TaxID=1464070 RepID=UPI0007C75C93|nr:TetR/AcrR family transcriptional regulator [Streptomyces graminilatus]
MPSPALPRTTDGRVPGQRGLRTRQLIVSTALDLFGVHSYRDVTVVEIARAAGTSPATVYQYFSGVEEIVLDAADHLARETADALGAFIDGSWATKGLPGAQQFVGAVLDHWGRHRAALRVIAALTAEADPRFVHAFKSVTRPVNRALAAAVERPMPSDGARKALVHGLVAVLVASATGQQRVALTANVSVKAQREGLAHLVHVAVSAPTNL